MIKAIVLLFLLVVVGELLAASLTGRARRGYTVLPDDPALTEYAARYLPDIRVNPNHVPPQVETIWYQAIDQGDITVLVYYLDWPNEIHNNPVFHKLYEFYRHAVYGSAHDIEYIEVHVDKSTGVVQRLRFETAEPGDYNRDWTVHLYAYVERTPDGYIQCALEAEGPCSSDTLVVQGQWDAEHRPVLGVMTWNHLYELLTTEDTGVYTETVQAPLRYLTDDAYRDYKMARRSQGDIKTDLDETPRQRLRILFWLLSAVVTAWVAFGGTRT